MIDIKSEQDKLWDRFCATGKVNDYLAYIGGVTPPPAAGATQEGQGAHADYDQRNRHTGAVG